MPCAPILGNREHYHPTQGSVCVDSGLGQMWKGGGRGHQRGRYSWGVIKALKGLADELNEIEKKGQRTNKTVKGGHLGECREKE